MLAYFKDPGSNPLGPRITMIYMFVLAFLGFLVAEQIITGWLALGERINISRRDINFIEWSVIIGSSLFGLAALRTALGLRKRDIAGWAWAQWVSFGAMMIGMAMVMKAVLPVASTWATGRTIPQFEMWWAIFGGALLITSAICYAYVTREPLPFDEQEEKRQGALGTSVREMAPGQFISYQLAKSPSAGAIIGFVVIFLGFSFATDLFLQSRSIASILTNISSKGIIAIGVTMLMISGEFDLSVGSMLGAVSTFFMLFMTEGVPMLGIAPMPVFVASLAALMVACLLGLVNGTILVRTGIPSFIVTLGTLLAYRAIPLVAIPGGRILRYRDYYDDFPQVYISPWVFVALAGIGLLILGFMGYRILPAIYRDMRHKWRIQHNNGHFGTMQSVFSGTALVIGGAILFIIGLWLVFVIWYHAENSATLVQVGFFDIANGRWQFTMAEVTRGLISVDIPVDANPRNAIIWWLLLAALFHIILTQTRYGNSIFAVGGNPGAARAQGINANRVKLTNFVLVALLTGVAAIFEVARNPGVDPLKGQGWELEVIAMTVIGGALLTGGYGSIVGTLLGVFIFGMLQTGLVLIGVNARLFSGVVGIILIVAVVLNTAVRRIPSR
jgi:ribose/xylose/arabinose/galactoside ABC-type transport system permease subunit